MCQGTETSRKTRERAPWTELGEPCPGPAQAACQQQVEACDGEREDDTDQPFGEYVERAGGGEAPAERARGRRLSLLSLLSFLSFREPEAEERGGEQQADQDVGDVDAREDEDAEA